MLNNLTTSVGLSGGPPHFVDLHVNPGESVSIQLFDGNETVLRGPATVTMISQHTFPPVPMPVQVPPGHMVQQIVDENGTLRHIILSAVNNNGTSNTTPPAATLVPQQQAYPYCCCCCYSPNFFSRDLLSSSMPSPNPLPTPPPPPPPPPPIHHSNLWEMGLTPVDTNRRLPFSRTSSKVNSCNLDMTFPSSPATTIRRRLPNRNYTYSKRLSSTLVHQATTTTTTTTSTTTSTTSTGSVNANTSITTTTITTIATGTSATVNSSVVNGLTTTTKLSSSSSGVLSIASISSSLTTSSFTTTQSSSSNTATTGTSSSATGSTVRGITGKSQTLTVTVSDTGSLSKTGAITFPVHPSLRTNGGNLATKLTTSIPELITSTEQSTKHHHHHHHQPPPQQHHSHHPSSHPHPHHPHHTSQTTKIEFLFTNSSNNNSMTTGNPNTNNHSSNSNKHNSIVSNLPSSTSNHTHNHHHPSHHPHQIVAHGGNHNTSDNSTKLNTEKETSSPYSHDKENSSSSASGLLVHSHRSTTHHSNQPSNGLPIGFPSSPVKNGPTLSSTGGTKGSTINTNKSTSSAHSSPKNDHLSKRVRREEKLVNNINNREDKESNKSKENTPQRKKSNINNSNNTSNGGANNNCCLEGEMGRNSNNSSSPSGTSSSSNSKESSPIKTPLNRLSHSKPTILPHQQQSSLTSSSIIPTINVTLPTGSTITTTTNMAPIINMPSEVSALSKMKGDLLVDHFKEGNKDFGQTSGVTTAPITGVTVMSTNTATTTTTTTIMATNESNNRSESNCLVVDSSKISRDSSAPSPSTLSSSSADLDQSKGNKSRNLIHRGQSQSKSSTLSPGALPTTNSLIVNENNRSNSNEDISSSTLVSGELRPNEKSSTIKSKVNQNHYPIQVQENGTEMLSSSSGDGEVNKGLEGHEEEAIVDQQLWQQQHHDPIGYGDEVNLSGSSSPSIRLNLKGNDEEDKGTASVINGRQGDNVGNYLSEESPGKVNEQVHKGSGDNDNKGVIVPSTKQDPNLIASEKKVKSHGTHHGGDEDKIDSSQQWIIFSSLSSSSINTSLTTTATPTTTSTCNGEANSVTLVEMIDSTDTSDICSHERDHHGVDLNEGEEQELDEEDDNDNEDSGAEEEEEEDEDHCISNLINNPSSIRSIEQGEPGDKMKNKSSPQRSPKHLLPQIRVFCLTYTSLTATSVKLKWINEQGHNNSISNNYHHSNSSSHHLPPNTFTSGSLFTETRHYMVEMMKSNRTSVNAKNGTVTPTTRIVYQGSQASCRVSHLTPSEQYSFRVRSSENNRQLVSNVLTLVTPEPQPISKHHKRSRTQNTNQQVQLSTESSQKPPQHINQNQDHSGFRQQDPLSTKMDGETRLIRSEQKCAIVIISLVSVLAVVLACIIHNLLMY